MFSNKRIKKLEDRIDELEIKIEGLEKTANTLDDDAHIFFSPGPWPYRGRTVLVKTVVEEMLYKLGLRIIREPPTQERFTLEKKQESEGGIRIDICEGDKQ
jgi:hypothetical protein